MRKLLSITAIIIFFSCTAFAQIYIRETPKVPLDESQQRKIRSRLDIAEQETHDLAVHLNKVSPPFGGRIDYNGLHLDMFNGDIRTLDIYEGNDHWMWDNGQFLHKTAGYTRWFSFDKENLDTIRYDRTVFMNHSYVDAPVEQNQSYQELLEMLDRYRSLVSRQDDILFDAEEKMKKK